MAKRNPEIWGTDTKRCSQCREFKPFDAFHCLRKGSKKGRLQAACKSCSNHNRYPRHPCGVCGKDCVGRRGRCRDCNRGALHQTWKGGRIVDSKGYVRILQPSHPRAGKPGYVFEHIVVMEAALGRPLVSGEEVHHRNGCRDDNRPENLELWLHTQPKGIRVEDAVVWAREILERYEGASCR